MPFLIPPVSVDTIEPYSEQRVISALMDQLPKECLVFHNFEYVTGGTTSGKGSNQRLLEGEIDAVILWPNKGLLVLEVKGGQIQYCDLTASWKSGNRNGQFSIKDPFQQARNNMHSLLDCMGKELKTNLKGALTYGYAVVFPTSNALGALPHSANPSIVCDAQKMETIGRFIEGALNNWQRNNNASFSNKFTLKQLHRAIIPAFNLVPSLKAQIDGDNVQLLRLTSDQRRFLDFAENLTRARVDGVAGSGKTLLAVEQARRYAIDGKRTLLLCYNKSLAEWIKDVVTDDESEKESLAIDVRTFHDFCAHACKIAGKEFAPDGTSEFWKEKTAELLAEASSSLEKYDAIVVDEGQDFREVWWLAIEECLAEDGRIMVFCDPQQDIFGAEGLSAIDVGDRVLKLPMNCRNSQNIAQFCGDIIDIDSNTHEKAPVGVPVKLQIEKKDERRLGIVQELVKKWIESEGLKPSQVAILSPWKKEKTCLAGTEKLGNVLLTDSIDDWNDGNGVLLTTIRGFKGLEADVVLLIDITSPGEHPVFSVSDYYVACSRAKSVLHVLARETIKLGDARAA